MAKRRNQTPVNYLSINKDGYLYKKTTEEAYEKAQEENIDYIKKVEMKDGRVYYHEIFDGGTDDGYLDYLGIREVTYNDGKQKQLIMVIKGEEESDMITIPLFRQNGSLNLYVKHLACILPNMDFSKRVNIVPSTKKNERGYTIQNVFINYVDEKDSFVRLAHKYGEKGDIPASEMVETLDGEKRDFTKQDNYLYKILIQEIERFKEFKGTNSTPENTGNEVANSNTVNPATPSEAFEAPKESPSAEQMTPPDLGDDDIDDLPF